ncbi:MAG: YdeI/OmpD-associated family protein [Chitinophagaceae bacterium]
MTWPQSVDEALCFGWIDGVRKSIDKESYQIRFTQRKPASIWSAINIKKIKELTKQGLMQPAGLASFQKRTESKSKIYSHEKNEVEFTKDANEKFKANKKAWKYFQSLAPSYKKTSTHWVISAKQESTRIKRLNDLISDSESGTNRWKDNKYKNK